MTIEEFEKIPFKFAFHMAMEDEHTSTYTAEYNGHTFAYCTHTPTGRGKAYRHYKIDGVVYKTHDKFIKALEKI